MIYNNYDNSKKYAFNLYDTKADPNDKNTLLIHNTNKNKYKESVYNNNTITIPPNIIGNPNFSNFGINKSSLEPFLKSNDIYNLNHNTNNYHKNFLSPLDNNITLDKIRGKIYNQRPTPYYIGNTIYNSYKDKYNNSSNSQRLQTFNLKKSVKEIQLKKACDRDFELSDISNKDVKNKNTNFMSSDIIINKDYSNMHTSSVNKNSNIEDSYNFNLLNNKLFKKEIKRDINLNYPDFKYNKSIEAYNQDPLFPNTILPSKASISNPIKGEPITIESSCKNCKFITPKEVMEMIKNERKANEMRINNYLNKLNKSVETVMNNFNILSNRVLQREEKILSLYQNQLGVRPIESDLLNRNDVKTPIPILNPVLKPKRYNRFKNNWKKVKLFCKVALFYFIVYKMGNNRNKKLGIFYNRDRTKESDYLIIKSFLLQEMKLFFDEFTLLNLKDELLLFNNEADEIKKLESFNKINSLLKTFIKCLIDKTLVLATATLPKKLLYVLYTYVTDKFYYHQTFLSTFEINRLEFNFYGEVKKFSKPQRGMIISFLLINKIFVQEVLLRPNKVFLHVREEIAVNNLYIIGSVIHYLVRDSFRRNPVYVKDKLNLANYYRNYHLDNYTIYQTAMDKFDSDKDFGNLFEVKTKLIDERELSIYFNENRLYVEQLKDDIFNWGCEFSNSIYKLWENRKAFIKPEDIIG